MKSNLNRCHRERLRYRKEMLTGRWFVDLHTQKRWKCPGEDLCLEQKNLRRKSSSEQIPRAMKRSWYTNKKVMSQTSILLSNNRGKRLVHTVWSVVAGSE